MVGIPSLRPSPAWRTLKTCNRDRHSRPRRQPRPLVAKLWPELDRFGLPIAAFTDRTAGPAVSPTQKVA
jgi:hypothetical protein